MVNIEKLYTPIKGDVIVVDGIKFECPKRDIEFHARNIAEVVIKRRQQKLLGELMFKYKDEKGLTEKTLKEEIKKSLEENDYSEIILDQIYEFAKVVAIAIRKHNADKR